MSEVIYGVNVEPARSELVSLGYDAWHRAVYPGQNLSMDEERLGEFLLHTLYLVRRELGNGEGQALARHIANLMEEDEQELCRDCTCENTIADPSDVWCDEHADLELEA
jgi:hypothetical protein